MEDTGDYAGRIQRAVIYAPDGADLSSIERCLNWAREQHYVMAGVVTSNFAAATAMLTQRQAEVLLVASGRHVPPRAVPRWEIVSDQMRHRRRNNGPAQDDARPIAARLRRPRPM